ncbi:Hint domain-containing protein [Rhodovulum adriaticum]|uniref:Hint domain-containing protein n=1 Tax=Rhodovulum adriaticum TaxID=35804 RepID=A0A4R2NIJ2_RHOAD|nr:Hint domain-containing protein [Rhodovulum adriaticum]MBK1635819.1 hypothetical protein [Rhodovulum adriaticum]TCP21015.1 Hint domain-containing protein [Rhodovulum adriaticum]
MLTGLKSAFADAIGPVPDARQCGQAGADYPCRCCASGLIAGTRVATDRGWQAVQDLVPGQPVLTFDRDFQPLRTLRREYHWSPVARSARAFWPLSVPVGALGNAMPLTLFPEQNVLLESDLAEARYGDPFVLVPARLLDGLRGIFRAPPANDPTEVITLQFDRDESVFVNGGALAFCFALAEGEMMPLDALCDCGAQGAGYIVPAPDEMPDLLAALSEAWTPV